MVRDRHVRRVPLDGGTLMHLLGIAMGNDDVLAALRRHWAASDANDFAAEHQRYRADAVFEYPQSGERIRGRANVEASRVAQPSTKRFTVRRMLGGGDLWISELVLTYDGQPFYVDRPRRTRQTGAGELLQPWDKGLKAQRCGIQTRSENQRSISTKYRR
jgi:SnoaL-like domain